MSTSRQFCNLGDVCEVIGGGTPSKSRADYYSGDIPWATVRDMNTDIIFQTEHKITEEGLKKSSSNLIPKNNVIIATRVGLGKVCLIESDTAINQDLRGIVPKSNDELAVRYLFWWLKSVAHKIEAEGTGATVKGVKLPFIKSLQIPLPDINEQKRIVEILDEAFEGIAIAKANAEKNLQNARALFENYLESIFTSDSEGWLTKTLGEEYDVRDGTHDSPKYEEEGYPLITSKNLKRDGLNFDNVKFINKTDYNAINKRSAVAKGDILIAMIGTIGNPIIVEVEPTFAIKNVALLKLRKNQSSKFLKYYLGSRFVVEKMMREAKGTTQKFVGLGYLRNFPINTPPLEVQELIVNQLSVVEEQSKTLEKLYLKKLVEVEALKKSLLDQAFSGKLTNKEVAA